ncbi:sulfatase-like hydrolase/transferase [Carboxylicivirga marina]|uniref:Sulfatase-like hydrolase/transferase n=1 Tax=Carboxylicivirga marina TaxID=2800988 RepID=A0ABS1HEK8_9BACT|nr:sulfatase-like hydrolase/transferase [Carboxylicivirga marina]MBK3516107.1 sulfatase-like hydrolase/transferase [Carboxylicivirga marina]
MKFLNSFLIIGMAVFFACQPAKQKKSEEPLKPNIVVIYLDDLGYSDLSSYGATEIQTPNIDALANGGIKFTNGYASSATCTPSRYALLTGVYPWKNKQAKILPGTAPLIIDTAQVTLPKMLKSNGYQTALVGKWHLGLGTGNVNWNRHVSPGPNEVGFDYAYYLAATQVVYLQFI